MTDPLLLPGTDVLSRSLYRLERLVASSAAFRALVGAGSVDAAKAKIEFKEADGDEQRPYACVSLLQPAQYNLSQGGDQNFLRPSGEVWLYLAADPPAQVLAASQPKKAELMWAAKTFGLIMDQMAAASNQDQTFDTDVTESQLDVVNLSMLDFCCTPEEYWPTFGRFWWCVISARWGDQA